MMSEVYPRFTMATVATKLPETTARALRKRARAEGKTQSEVLREALDEYLAPTSQEWAAALLRLPRLKGPHRTAEELEDAIADAGR